MLKFKVGDEVLVTAGKDKGKKGKIEKVLPKVSSVVVSGINLYKRNSKGSGTNKPGGILDIVKPIQLGNIQLSCPKCNLPTRVAFQQAGKDKNRVCKKCGQVI